MARRTRRDKDKNEKQPERPEARTKKDAPKPMVVPPEAKQKQDLSFLKGDWRSRTGLRRRGREGPAPRLQARRQGQGQGELRAEERRSCEAPAEARWDNGKLVIEEKANPTCGDGKTYARNIVNCEVGPDGTAQCKGSQPGDSKSYNVQIGH